MSYGKVAVFGGGLIGGSLGLELCGRKIAREVCFWGRDPEKLGAALSAGACTLHTTDLKEGAVGSEIIVLATPPAVILELMERLLPALEEGMLVIDVGSVKKDIIRKSDELGFEKYGAEFVGCHPMAGSEKTGVQNARPGLFENAPCVITPSPRNTQGMLEKAETFWSTLGARVMRLDPEKHDFAVGVLSHLPHAVSSALLLSAFSALEDNATVSELSGTGFRDMTRIAGASASLWADIYLSNRDNLIAALDAFESSLKGFREAVLSGERERVEKFLENPAALKKGLEETPGMKG